MRKLVLEKLYVNDCATVLLVLPILVQHNVCSENRDKRNVEIKRSKSDEKRWFLKFFQINTSIVGKVPTDDTTTVVV